MAGAGQVPGPATAAKPAPAGAPTHCWSGPADRTVARSGTTTNTIPLTQDLSQGAFAERESGACDRPAAPPCAPFGRRAPEDRPRPA